MSHHLGLLIERAPSLRELLPELQHAYKMMRDCYRAGNRVLLCGNGGSAADCEHWAGELLKGFYQKRPLSKEERHGMSEPMASQLQGALPTIPLTGFLGLSSAFSNDVDPTLIFAQLVFGLGRPGDLLVGISTSGNAKNVRAALEVARARKIATLGLSGKTGGAMKPLCDLCLCVPETETYRIQELHLPIYHCLSLMLEEEFFPEA